MVGSTFVSRQRRRSTASNQARFGLALSLVLGLGLGLLATGCTTPRIGTTASSFLRHARESDDPNIRYHAYTKLGNPRCYDDDQQKAEAAVLLAEALDSREEATAIRAVICRTLGEIGRPEARPALTRALQDADPLVRVQACRAIGQIGHPEDAPLLARLMTTDITRDGRIAAINALADMKTEDPRIGLKLVEGMKNSDPAIRVASYDALCALSGQDLGIQTEPWQELVQARLEQTLGPGAGYASEPEIQQASAADIDIDDGLPPIRPRP